MKSKLKHIAIILLGSCILAFGMYNIHDQAKITEGGVLGLILLFQAWFHISPSIIGPVLDGLCYLIGWKVLGNRFLKNAILASCGFSLFYRCFETIGPVFPEFIKNPIIAAFLGACFVGLGVGLVVKENKAFFKKSKFNSVETVFESIKSNPLVYYYQPSDVKQGGYVTTRNVYLYLIIDILAIILGIYLMTL